MNFPSIDGPRPVSFPAPTPISGVRGATGAGEDAAACGRPETDNPHPEGTREHTEWRDGWRRAIERQ